jgi:predicted RNA-binding protein with PIN domain
MSDRHHIVVDGYNLILRGYGISAQNDESSLEQARQRLLHQLDRYRAGKNILVTVVFDGQTHQHSSGSTGPSGINVIFSRPPQNADHVIIQILEKQTNKRNATLVTSDQALATLGRSIGCNHITVEQFMNKAAVPPADSSYRDKFNPPQSKKEIEEWLKIFSGHEKTKDDSRT